MVILELPVCMLGMVVACITRETYQLAVQGLPYSVSIPRSSGAEHALEAKPRRQRGLTGRTLSTVGDCPGAQSREERSKTGAPLLMTGPVPAACCCCCMNPGCDCPFIPENVPLDDIGIWLLPPSAFICVLPSNPIAWES